MGTHTAKRRSEEVQARLGPIMKRMTSSLATIQALEVSLCKSCSNENMVDGQDKSLPPMLHDPTMSTLETKHLIQPGSDDLKRILKSRMAMLKRKLLTLQKMEEELAWYEERKHSLQHYVLQSSSSMTAETEIASIPKTESGEETSYQRIQKLEDALAKANQQNQKYEKELKERDFEIDSLHDRCNSLESQVRGLKECSKSNSEDESICKDALDDDSLSTSQTEALSVESA